MTRSTSADRLAETIRGLIYFALSFCANKEHWRTARALINPTIRSAVLVCSVCRSAADYSAAATEADLQIRGSHDSGARRRSPPDRHLHASRSNRPTAHYVSPHALRG